EVKVFDEALTEEMIQAEMVPSVAKREVVPIKGIKAFHQGDSLDTNGSVLKIADGSGMAKGDANDPSTWTISSTAWEDDWQGFSSDNSGNNTWVVLDLGVQTFGLDKMYLWNVQETSTLDRGTSTFDVYYAYSPSEAAPDTSGAVTPYDFGSGGWIQLSTGNNLAQGTKIGDPGEVFDISGASGARYIGLHLTANHGGSRTGLGEIAIIRTLTTIKELYESNANEEAVVDAASVLLGDPSSYIYQWYFNDGLIPTSEGGSDATYSINGVPENEGTWRVLISDRETSETIYERTFEYRIFVDTDGDGLSDYREQNLTNTNFEVVDTDEDGLSDGEEVTLGTDPLVADTDDDGFSDYFEVRAMFTDPLVYTYTKEFGQVIPDLFGSNFLELNAMQAGSFSEIDNIEIIDLKDNSIFYSDDFSVDRDLWEFHHRRDDSDPNSEIVSNSALSRIEDGTLKLETVGFGSNGSGAYNSISGAILRLQLPEDFSLSFDIKRNQWSGHARLQFIPSIDHYLETPRLQSNQLPYPYFFNWGGTTFGGTKIFSAQVDDIGPGSGASGSLSTGNWHRLTFEKGDGVITVLKNGEMAIQDSLSAYNYQLIGNHSLVSDINGATKGFYESNANEEIVVDASEGFEDSSGYLYQWYFNDVLIPTSEGGNEATYSINGVPENEGTWKVLISDRETIYERTFEYRIFVDTDGDGLSDYREQNLTNTNFEVVDTDEDGLSDGEEVTLGTEPLVADTDEDGFSDYFEANITKTSPNIKTSLRSIESEPIYRQNFSDFNIDGGQTPDGSIVGGERYVPYISGISEDPFLVLTQDGNSGSNYYKLPTIDFIPERFEVKFDLQINGNGGLSDGFSITFGDIPDGSVRGEFGYAEPGSLVIGWDTYPNSGEQTSVEVFGSGVSLGNHPHDFYSTKNKWVPVEINWDNDILEVKYDGDIIFENLITAGFDRTSVKRLAFAATAGGDSQSTYIDNIEVNYYSDSIAGFNESDANEEAVVYASSGLPGDPSSYIYQWYF
ncbi:hypothetical protein N9C66_11145, partial [Akkermansiaceae bacterium]|nr:hypothetical protein [Akkermansiaceae bacterium]